MKPFLRFRMIYGSPETVARLGLTHAYAIHPPLILNAPALRNLPLNLDSWAQITGMDSWPSVAKEPPCPKE